MSKMRTILLFISIFLSLNSFSQEIWSVEKCIDHALSNNLDLALQDINTELAELQLKQGKYDMTPSINGQIDFTESFGRSIDPTTNTFSNLNTLSNRYQITTTMDLFNGLTRWNTLKKNRLEVEVATLGRRVYEESIQLQILTTYLTILKAKEQLGQAQTQKSITQEQLNRSNALVDAGVLPKNDLIALRAQVANDEIFITTYKNQIELNLTTLKLTLRLDPSQVIDVVVPNLPDVEDMDGSLASLSTIYDYAVKNRPEIKSVELLEDVNEYDIKIAKGGYLPRLSFFAAISTNYSNQFKNFSTGIDTATIGVLLSDFTEPVIGFVPTTVAEDVKYPKQLNQNMSYALGLTLSVPIFNKGLNKLNVERTNIMKSQAMLTTEKTKMDLFNTLQQAYSTTQAAVENYKAAKVNLEAATESLESSKSKLEKGVGTNLEFNVASSNWNIASSRLIESKYDYIFNIKYLDFFQGKPIIF